jgi:HPt (histidine-containing phosphotransfer) domain-containing protein
LARSIEAGDLEALHRATHALVGACGSVGAAALEDKARAILGALRNGQGPVVAWDQARALDAGLRQLAGQIAAALDVNVRPAP